MALGKSSSQRFGYAVHALCYMAKQPPRTLVTLSELAEWMRKVWPSASETYLSNIIQRLARGGVLQSHRGISGGYSLAKAPKKISLRDITELLDGVALDRCGLSLEAECPVQGRCAIPRTLRKLEEQYLKSLAEVSIADLAKQITVVPSQKVPSKPTHVR